LIAIHRDELYWIGLTDKDTEREFVWDSDAGGLEYSNWNAYEPNGSDDPKYGENDEDCVHLTRANQGRTWNDLSCSEYGLFALCEKGWV
jgi:hypothetical protein